MPGVPHEMKAMMENTILPKLAKHFTLPKILHKTLVTANIAESVLAERLQDFENNLPTNINLAYLPILFTAKNTI
jgi:nicotinamide-nucleotide amidase